MKLRHIAFGLLAIAAGAAWGAKATPTLKAVKVSNVDLTRQKDNMKIAFDIDFSQVSLKSDQQVIYTPVLVGGKDSVTFSPIVLNGRNAALREERDPGRAVKGATTLKRLNGKSQTLPFSATLPYADWMDWSRLYLAEDLCGCGNLKDQDRIPVGEFDNRPAPPPAMTFITPKAEAVKPATRRARHSWTM